MPQYSTSLGAKLDFAHFAKPVQIVLRYAVAAATPENKHEWLENGLHAKHTRARRQTDGRRPREEDRDHGDELRVPPLREPSLQAQGRPLVPIDTEHEQEGFDREQCGLEQAERRDRRDGARPPIRRRAQTRARPGRKDEARGAGG